MAGEEAFDFGGGTPAPQVPQDDSIAPIPQGNQAVLSPTSQQTLGSAMLYGLPSLGVGLADTLGQSVGVLHDDTMPKIMKRLTGEGEGSWGDFYARNQKGIRTGGELVGMFLPGLGAMKLLRTVNGLREAGSLGVALKNSASMDIMLGNTAQMTALETKIAQETLVGAEAQGIWAGRSVATPAVKAAKRNYYAARAVDAARATAAFEVGNWTAFNSSDTFYPADYTLTDQLKWAGVGLAAGVGLELAAAKYAAKNIIQGALKDSANGVGSMGPNLPTKPAQANVANTIFRPNDRGIGVTQYAYMHQDLKDTVEIANNATLKSNLSQDMVNIKSVLATQVKNMAYDTHAILPRTSLSDDQTQLALNALEKNPNTLLYAKKLAGVPGEGPEEFYKNLTGIVEKTQRDYHVDTFAASNMKDPEKAAAAMTAANAKIAKMEAVGNEVHYVIENDGRFTPYKNRADNWLDTNSFGSIKRTTYVTPTQDINGQNVTLKNSKLIAKGDNEIVLHDNFRYEMPKGATPKDYSALYAMGSKLINEWKPVEGQYFILTPQVDWRTTEMTLALIDKHPEAQALVKLGGATEEGAKGFETLDDVRFHVLNEKLKEFSSLMPSTERKSLTGVRARVASLKENYTPAQVLQRLNLPEPIIYQPHPVVEMAAHMKLQGMDDLTQMFPPVKNADMTPGPSQWEFVQQHLRETVDLGADQSRKINTAGELLNQKDVRPLFVASTGVPLMSRADAMIGGMVQAKRDVQLERLGQISPEHSPLVSNVISKIVTGTGTTWRNPMAVDEGRELGVTAYTGLHEGGDLAGAANTARAVQTLQDGLLSGSGQVVYQDRINEQFATLKAAQLIAQDTDKFVDNYVSKLASAKLTPATIKLLNPKNKGDLFDFNRIEQSYRHGWEIGGVAASPTGQGMVFTLKPNSKINTQLMERHFSQIDPAEINFLPDMSITAVKNGNHQPLVVTNTAADAALAMSEMSRQSGKENNALRTALGKNPIQIRDFHLPTPELSRDGTYFVRNSTGNVIATYGGDNTVQNRQRAEEAAQKLFDATGESHVAIPLDTVQRDHAIFDDNMFSLIDYSDQLAKTGKAMSGGLQRSEIDTSDATIKGMIKSLQQQYLNIGVRARAAIFEPEIQYAKQAAQMSPRDALGNMNVFDRYISTMFSQNPTSGRGLIAKNLYGGIETALDKSLSWLSAYHSELTGGEANTIGAKALRTVLRKQSSEEEFKQFSKTLPSWSPFNDANKWAESTFREKMPWTVRPIAGKISAVSSTLALRFLDVGSALNNFAGLMANSPAVVTALRKLPDETHQQWIDRTAAWGTQLADGVVSFSPMKALRTGVKAYWNDPEVRAAMQDAAKHGYFEPEYASLHKVLTTPLGNNSDAALSKFVETASYLADKSEIKSRQISWAMGYRIGKDLHGFKDDRNAYIFANNFVNDMIGNYSPNNKPAMFSGAVGLPLGAFQTYMFNFMRRVYGAVERKDKATLIAQYATQASMFGSNSVPGYAAWNQHYMSDDLGRDDFGTRLDRNLPAGVSELLQHGSISSIPKIFGADSGLAFYTRGSADITQIPPTIMDVNKAPPIQFLAGVYNGTVATINNIFSNEKFSIQQQEEILARFTNNRALKSIMEMAADAKTDARGAVIEKGTRDAIHVAAALLGTQPSHTRRMQDSYYKERSVQLTQADRRAVLNDKTRALIRGGEFDIDDLQGVLKDYQKSGGNMAYIGQWYRNNLMDAMTPKAQQKMLELARSGKLIEFENMMAAMQQNETPGKGN